MQIKNFFNPDQNPQNSPAGQHKKQKDRAILPKPKLIAYMCMFEPDSSNKSSPVWADKATNGLRAILFWIACATMLRASH